MKKIFAILTLAVAPLMLTACGGAKAPQSPAQTVFTVEGTYTAALNVAVAYRHLPVCGSGAALCHDPAVVAKMVTANQAARTALSTAETLVRDDTAPADKVAVAVLAAEQLVLQFQTLTQGVQTK